MSLEIAGSRVLAPHFGSSVFVWGSLISVFLIALSVGYYLGGQLADRHPSRLLLHSICVVVAFLIFGIAMFSRGLCEWLVENGAGEQTGPLIAAMILFLPPSVGMGIVSPFAIRLAAQSFESVGSVAGKMYALSTVGSIAGTLLTTFVLVPQIGLYAILKSLAVVLLLSAILTLPFWRHAVGAAVATSVALLCVFAPPPLQTPLAAGDVLVLDCSTPYHHISVVDGDGRREIRFDRYVESSIETKPPHRSLSGYTYYFQLAFLAKPQIERTLFIGAGGGVGPRAFHMQDPQMRLDVVDIDPKVIEIARTHFALDETPQIRTFAQDGRMFLRRTDGRYDCVVLDAFTVGGRIPFHLVTRDSLELCRDRMTEDGVFVMNVGSALDGRLGRIFQSMYRTIDAVFPHTYVFPLNGGNGQPEDSTNIILLATKSAERISPEDWLDRAERFESRSYVRGDQIQAMAADLLADVPLASGAVIFTDDYAPIETMPF
jgi:spermidine synthase